MSKKIYVLVWTNEDGNSGVDGYWNKPLTEEQQHGHFKEFHPYSYDPCGGARCDITWELVELSSERLPLALPSHEWSGNDPRGSYLD
jgi:hypothetical protein